MIYLLLSYKPVRSSYWYMHLCMILSMVNALLGRSESFGLVLVSTALFWVGWRGGFYSYIVYNLLLVQLASTHCFFLFYKLYSKHIDLLEKT